MAHAASSAIQSWLDGCSTNPPQLDAVNHSVISANLQNDVYGMYYSALVSLADAIYGASKGRFSWSIVKLYYSCFYSARAVLGANGIAIFYDGSKPRSLDVTLHSSPVNQRGTTHKLVWKVIRSRLSNISILGEISGENAEEWFMRIREDVNYRTPKFIDPIVPAPFYELDRVGIDKSIMNYCSDISYNYCFDADHAIVAFPIECLKFSVNSLTRVGLHLEEADKEHVLGILSAAGINVNSVGGALWR